MAELPRHEALTEATGDAFRSSRLDRMLANFSASYKLYWLRGVFDEAEHRTEKRTEPRTFRTASNS